MRVYIPLGLLLAGVLNADSGTAMKVNAPVAEVKAVLKSRSDVVKAAHDFAASLATANQAKAIQNFAAAYKLAEHTNEATPQTGVVTPSVATKPTQWQEAALNSKVFQGNFVKTLDAAINQKSVVGEPVPVEQAEAGLRLVA